jgi:tetratricopeptide (TPR) repeat protein
MILTGLAGKFCARAAQLGPNDAIALAASSFALSYVGHDLDSAVALVDRALILDPNLAAGWDYSGSIRNWLSEPEMGIDHTARAVRLSPLDPLLPRRINSIGFAHFVASRYEEALAWARRAMRDQPKFLGALRLVAASSALTGRMDEAREAAARHYEIDPMMRVSKLSAYNPLRRPDDLARFAEGLRLAGMPE